jgi:UDP-sulfoquinovose synthase
MLNPPSLRESPIIVLGGDGYLGWPLSLSLARKNPLRRIILVDSLLRRRLVGDVGGCSLLPILSPEKRLQEAARIFNLHNLQFLKIDINSEALDTLIKECQPEAIYHLAQQCSAPYSMRGCEEALFTLYNNEGGNMRLLWAVKKYTSDCHIIKLGSFGEYAKSGIDVCEGYFQPEFRGKHAQRPVPYPREADDFYHASKINDTNYISIACRKWGLRITDVMQSTVFGSWTEEIDGHNELFTRIDYDESFGTVANRFVVQAQVVCDTTPSPCKSARTREVASRCPARSARSGN